jgi:hypothetical protein
VILIDKWFCPTFRDGLGSGHASSRCTYGRILRSVVTEFGSDPARGIAPERFAAWFTARWAGWSPSTWIVSLDAVRSAAA